LGAMESYIVKADRGRAVHDSDPLGMSYWVERNWCVETDTTIAALKSERDAILTRLRDDPQVDALHNAAVAWRHARFEALMLQEPFRALFGRLLMTPPSTPVSLESARFLFRFAQMARAAKD